MHLSLEFFVLITNLMKALWREQTLLQDTMQNGRMITFDFQCTPSPFAPPAPPPKHKQNQHIPQTHQNTRLPLLLQLVR